MGYCYDNSVKVIQIILQNSQCLDIQIIRRLIQDQHIRRTHQHTHQIQSPLFSSGKLLDFRPLHGSVK